MGLLDDLVGAIGSGSAANQTQASVISALTGLLGNAQSGGLGGVVQAFEQAGLGNLVQSWISTGQNLPASAEQITQALGGGQLGAMASKLGLQNHDAANLIAQVLPKMIDQLTPNGALPQQGDIVSSLTNLAQSFFKS